MEELQSFGVFTGEPGHMTFKYSIDNFINNEYFIAGQLVQWNIRKKLYSVSLDYDCC